MLFGSSLSKKWQLISFSIAVSIILINPSWSTADNDSPDPFNNTLSKLSPPKFKTDTLNFLYVKHQNNSIVLNESRKILVTQANQYILSQLLSPAYPTEESFIIGLMNAFLCRVDEPELCEGTAQQVTELMKLALEDTKAYFNSIDPLSAQERVIYKCKSQTQRTVIEDLVTGAQEIAHLLTRKGVGPLLFLGRTPSILQWVYQEISVNYSSSLSKNLILHLNFSGTPDIENMRTNESDWVKVTARNLVTPQKLEFFCKYMDVQCMNQVGNLLYVVDIIETGASLNSFIRIIEYYYKCYLKREATPTIHFIGINLNYTSIVKKELYTFNPTTGDITFNPAPDSGIKPLKIMTTPLALSYPTYRVLDYGLVQDLLSHGVYLPAQKWREESLAKMMKGDNFTG